MKDFKTALNCYYADITVYITLFKISQKCLIDFGEVSEILLIVEH